MGVAPFPQRAGPDLLLHALAVVDRTAPGARLLAAPFDELLEVGHAVLDARREDTERVAHAFHYALRVVGHHQAHLGAIGTERFEAHRARIRRAGYALPGNAAIGFLLGDLRVPLLFLAPDVRAPVQVRIVELPHFLDAFHEVREILELRPLVVDGTHGAIDFDGLLNLFHGASPRVLGRDIASRSPG